MSLLPQAFGAGDSFYYPGFFSQHEADELYQRLNQEVDYLPRDTPALQFKIYGKTLQLPRDKQFFSDRTTDGSTYLYRYSGPKVGYPVTLDWTPTLQRIRDVLAESMEGYVGQYNTHLVANRYLGGQDHISMHRDKTQDFLDGSSVYTVSFGGTRLFRLENQAIADKQEVELTHGSLFVLGWRTNQDYKHSIVKTARHCDSRTSLTYRSIQTLRNPASGQIVST
jgi:alkylated DNA repair dioxygenase AlkB